MSLYKRGNVWWGRFRIRGRKQTAESAGTQDREAAEEWYAKRKAELWRQSRLGERPALTFDQVALDWIETHARHKRSFSTDQTRLRGLMPYLSGRRIDSIKTADLTGMRTLLTANPATANRFLALVSAILNHAHKRDWLAAVPHIPYAKEPKGRVRYLSAEEIPALLAELPLHLQRMARLSLATGLRRANVTGLKWENIDMGRRVAWVWPDEVKAGEALCVPLNDDAAALLRECWGDDQEWVFVYKARPVRETLTKAFKKACTRAGISDFTWHDLRHTWASWHVMNGTPLEVLQKLGGWKSFAMVLRYAHLAPGHTAGYSGNAPNTKTFTVAQAASGETRDK